MGLSWCPSLLLETVMLLLGGCFGTSSHSLRYFYSGVLEPGQGLPHFIQVGYLDEQPIEGYDSNTRRDEPRVPWMKKAVEGDPRYWERETQFAQNAEQFFQRALVTLKNRYNQSGEPPTVKVTHKAGYDGMETHICQAHGFYPKEIDINWMKDGEVWTQDTFHGGVSPNSDGTYHTRLSVEVETKDRDRYQCHVEHDGLQEPLDVSWEEPASVPMGGIVGVAVGVTVIVVMLAAGMHLRIWTWHKKSPYQLALKREQAEAACEATSTSDEESASSDRESLESDRSNTASWESDVSTKALKDSQVWCTKAGCN